MSSPVPPPDFPPPPPPPPPPFIESEEPTSTVAPEGPLVAEALEACLKTGDYTGFGAELDRSNDEGLRRRIEVSGDGRVRESWTGALEGPPARSIGVRSGTVPPAALEALVEACRVAAMDVQGTNEEAPAILRVQAGDAHVSGVPAKDAVHLLEAAFEGLAEATEPLAELALALQVRREGERWRGVVRLSNPGIEPVVCLHPGHAARLGVLTLRHGEYVVDWTVEGDRERILLHSGAWTEAAFDARPLPHRVSLVLHWSVRYPLLDAMLGGWNAPEGQFESAPVDL